MKNLPNSMIRLLFLLALISLASVVHAAPTDQPRLQAGDISYLGYFTMPSAFSQEVRGMGISADGTQLYVGQYPSSLGLVNIPNLGGTATQVIAPKAVPGSITGSSPESAELSGVLVYNNRLIVSKRYYWDENGPGGTSHAFGSTNITGFSSFNTMANANYRQYTNGYLGVIPAEWQPLLGGTAFAGNSAMSLIQGNSNGPSFYAFNPDDVGVKTPIPNQELMVFPFGQEIMGVDPRVANDWFVANDQENAGMIFPSGTRSVLFFSRHGVGKPCYGTAAQCSNDPCNPYHGEHGYPYRRQITAFDASELLAVKNGTKQPQDVVPYAWWEVPGMPEGQCEGFQYSALAYDPNLRRIYVAGFDYWDTHRIYVLQVAGGTTTPPPGPDTTSPTSGTPLPSGTLSAGTTSANINIACSDSTGVTGGRWSTSNIGYDSMSAANTLTNSGGNTWGTTVTGLKSGQSYNYYLACTDAAGNDSTPQRVSFSVAALSAGRTVNVANLAGLYAAFSSEQEGDEIVIAPGVYTLNSNPLIIDANNVTVRGSTGNRNDVVIRGDAMSAGANIKVIFYFPQGPNGQNTTIRDLSIGRVGWHTILFNGNGSGNGSTIDNVRLFDSYEQLLKAAVDVSGSDNITVKNSLFEYTAGIGPQFYIGGVDTLGAENWTVQDNVFLNIESPSGSISNPAIHHWSNTTFAGNMLIERNKIINCDRGIGIWNGTGASVVRNNIVVSDGSNLFSDVGIDIQNTPNTKVYNNTVWIEGAYPNAIELRGATTVNSLVVNNLTSKQIVLFNGATGTKSNNVQNASSSWFVSTATGDLHLTSSVNGVTGSGVQVTGLVDDFDGDLRVGSIDIGADQLGQNTAISPPTGLKIIMSN